MQSKPLEQIKIQSPCPMSWEDMAGDAKSRFCDQCELHVHNLSAMTRKEADGFMAEQTGRACLRMVRRPDGSVVTTERPGRLRRVWSRAAGFLVLALGLSTSACGNESDSSGDPAQDGSEQEISEEDAALLMELGGYGAEMGYVGE